MTKLMISIGSIEGKKQGLVIFAGKPPMIDQ